MKKILKYVGAVMAIASVAFLLQGCNGCGTCPKKCARPCPAPCAPACPRPVCPPVCAPKCPEPCAMPCRKVCDEPVYRAPSCCR